jgi:hypothetical protein
MVLILPNRRSKFEDRIEAQIKATGLKYTYEEHKLPYIIPARKATYIPDFKVGPIFIEAKGNFNIRGRSADERKKLIHVKLMNPEIDLRIVFADASKPIYKGAKVTHGMWAEANGIPWADKGIIPEAWFIEAQKWYIMQQSGFYSETTE